VNSSIGNWLVITGIVVIALGLIVKTGAFSWFGHLPGDIEIRRDSFRLYFPLMSMILVSVGLTVLVSVIRRLL